MYWLQIFELYRVSIVIILDYIHADSQSANIRYHLHFESCLDIMLFILQDKSRFVTTDSKAPYSAFQKQTLAQIIILTVDWQSQAVISVLLAAFIPEEAS